MKINSLFITDTELSSKLLQRTYKWQVYAIKTSDGLSIHIQLKFLRMFLIQGIVIVYYGRDYSVLPSMDETILQRTSLLIVRELSHVERRGTDPYNIYIYLAVF